MDSWSLLQEGGHQEGGRVGYTRQGNKPCHRALVAGLAEVNVIAGYAPRRGDSHCVNGAAEFLRQTVSSLPRHIRVGLVRGDSGFGDHSVMEVAGWWWRVAGVFCPACLVRHLGLVWGCDLRS